MNRIKTKNRSRLEPYHPYQMMMVKSVLTTTAETTEDDSDDELATYHDSAKNLEKVYEHWKSIKTRRSNLN